MLWEQRAVPRSAVGDHVQYQLIPQQNCGKNLFLVQQSLIGFWALPCTNSLLRMVALLSQTLRECCFCLVSGLSNSAVTVCGYGMDVTNQKVCFNCLEKQTCLLYNCCHTCSLKKQRAQEHDKIYADINSCVFFITAYPAPRIRRVLEPMPAILWRRQGTLLRSCPLYWDELGFINQL